LLRVDGRRAARRARRGARGDRPGCDRRPRGAAPADARLGVLVGRGRGRAVRARGDARAGRRARAREAATAALRVAVRIVATAAVPPVGREAFAPLGEIEVDGAGDLRGVEVLIVRGTPLGARSIDAAWDTTLRA